jgi:glycosyltransferase involved in cell wall biosynthesis
MAKLKLPHWIKANLFENKNFNQFTDEELGNLKERLKRFNEADPDVSVVIPAYNEENNICRTLSSLSNNSSSYKVEIIVINNNSTDKTQEILDKLGVKSFVQSMQGIAYARHMGLEQAKGRYQLCADADTLYPPDWIELMVQPMVTDKRIVGVYGRYSILPSENGGRTGLWLYEMFTGILFRLRKKRREHINMLGFNMGFVTEIGKNKKGFEVREVRKFNNDENSKDFTEVSEDGQMAVQLLTVGKLKMITDPKARVYTSPRKILQDGGLIQAFFKRLKKHSHKILTYYFYHKKLNSPESVKN